MSTDLDFATLLARLRDGDDNAAHDIFQRFAQRLIALAHSRMTSAIRQKLDPEDVMQSVFKSFFARQDLGHFDLADWDSLWSLLTLITLRKCGYRIRQFQVACRDVRREEARGQWEGIAREATPVEAAMLADAVETMFHGLKDGEPPIVELALQGYKAPEISDQLGVAERSVYRILERLKGKLERLAADN